MTDMTVANTILQQLGGNRFRVMTGANSFTGTANSLTFRIGRNAKRVSAVRITLDPSDTYTVEFLRTRVMEVTTLAKVSDVYCEDLQDTFTEHTGLYTSLR